MAGERKKEGSAWITWRLWSRRSPNFRTGLFECERPFIDEPMVITEPAVPSARVVGLGSKLYPSNMQRMLTKKILLNSCRVFLENAKIERKTLRHPIRGGGAGGE